MKELIIEKLKQSEANLAVYNRYVSNPAQSEDNRKVVSFKLLFEMMAFSTLHALVPEYVPSAETTTTVALNLGAVAHYVDVVNGEVVISPQYKSILAQKEQYLNKQNEDKK